MNKLTLNIDMDGVVYSMMGELTKLADTEEMRAYMKSNGFTLPTDLQADIHGWDIWSSWGIDKRAFWKLFYMAVELGLFRNGKPIKGSINTIGRLIKDGHRIRIVTSKQFSTPSISEKAQCDTLLWLYERTNWVQKAEIVFAHNKQGYPADIVIDDKPDLLWAQQDAVNLLFSQPWNSKVRAAPCGSWPVPATTYRTKNWKDVEYLIDKIANQ